MSDQRIQEIRDNLREAAKNKLYFCPEDVIVGKKRRRMLLEAADLLESLQQEQKEPLTCVGCQHDDAYERLGHNALECIWCKRGKTQDHFEPKGEPHV